MTPAARSWARIVAGAVTIAVFLTTVLVVAAFDARPDRRTPATSSTSPASTILTPPTSAEKPPTTALTTSTRHTSAVTRPSAWPWGPLADCESGAWDARRPFGVVAGSRNWADDRAPYEGGVHFLNSTWLSHGGAEFAQHAYQATAAEQIVIARRVLADQGWPAWPVCSRKVGAR